MLYYYNSWIFRHILFLSKNLHFTNAHVSRASLCKHNQNKRKCIKNGILKLNKITIVVKDEQTKDNLLRP